jgi:hypothetical protein
MGDHRKRTKSDLMLDHEKRYKYRAVAEDDFREPEQRRRQGTIFDFDAIEHRRQLEDVAP